MRFKAALIYGLEFKSLFILFLSFLWRKLALWKLFWRRWKCKSRIIISSLHAIYIHRVTLFLLFLFIHVASFSGNRFILFIWLQNCKITLIFFWLLSCKFFLILRILKGMQLFPSLSRIFNILEVICLPVESIGVAICLSKNSESILINSSWFCLSFLLLAFLASLINCFHLSCLSFESIVHMKNLSGSSSLSQFGKYLRSSGTSLMNAQTAFTPNSLYGSTGSSLVCLCSILYIY